jgi:hypothetical protein
MPQGERNVVAKDPGAYEAASGTTATAQQSSLPSGPHVAGRPTQPLGLWQTCSRRTAGSARCTGNTKAGAAAIATRGDEQRPLDVRTSAQGDGRVGR